MEIINIPIENIASNPHQPRTEFDAVKMASLVESIGKYGIIQPLLVTPSIDNSYTLIAGERRLRAARVSGLNNVPAIIYPKISDRKQVELALIENIQRVDLNPIEKAQSFSRLIDEFNMTHAELSILIGVDRSTVSNILRLLKLPNTIQDALLNEQISERQALAILPLYDTSLLRHNMPYYTDSPELIIQAALDGKSSVKLRKRVDKYLTFMQRDYNDIPALALVHSKTTVPDVTEWDIWARLNKLPPWIWVRDATRETCNHCDLRKTASEKNCAKCPAIELLSFIMKNME